MYGDVMVELESICPAPSPKRKPVGVVLPVPPLATVSVPVVSAIAMFRVEVDVVAHDEPVKKMRFP